MAKKIYEETFDSTSPPDQTVSTSIKGKDEQFTLLYVNDTDSDITVEAKLTHADDVDLSDAMTANTQEIAEGERGSDALLEEPWERMGAVISFNGIYNSGALKVYHIKNPQ